MKQNKRIAIMSEYLEQVKNTQKELEKALKNFKNSQKNIKKLSKYYFDGFWRKDYEADEQGSISKNINRGALSQDGIYDVICENKNIAKQMQKLAKNILSKK